MVALCSILVIAEYLDKACSGQKSFPGRVQYPFQALLDGACGWANRVLLLAGATNASVLRRASSIYCRHPKLRPAPRSPLSNARPRVGAAISGIGHIAMICALGQMDSRFDESGWRPPHQNSLPGTHPCARVRPSPPPRSKMIPRQLPRRGNAAASAFSPDHRCGCSVSNAPEDKDMTARAAPE